jgi:hypothetical protein
MQVVALALLKKAAPYLALAIFGLCIGSYFGYLIESNGVAAAKLALSVQQANDAKAVADANAAAAAALAKESADANKAEAALALSDKQANAQDTALSSQISAQAAQPGQDAPDAPVLSNTLDALKAVP